MNSCSEAKQFLQNCPGMEMEGMAMAFRASSSCAWALLAGDCGLQYPKLENRRGICGHMLMARLGQKAKPDLATPFARTSYLQMC